MDPVFDLILVAFIFFDLFIIFLDFIINFLNLINLLYFIIVWHISDVILVIVRYEHMILSSSYSLGTGHFSWWLSCWLSLGLLGFLRLLWLLGLSDSSLSFFLFLLLTLRIQFLLLNNILLKLLFCRQFGLYNHIIECCLVIHFILADQFILDLVRYFKLFLLIRLKVIPLALYLFLVLSVQLTHILITVFVLLIAAFVL